MYTHALAPIAERIYDLRKHHTKNNKKWGHNVTQYAKMLAVNTSNLSLNPETTVEGEN